MSALVFVDTETTGLAWDDQIWEFAAIRREADGREWATHLLIEHDVEKCQRLPEPFLTDHNNRFSHTLPAISRRAACRIIPPLFGDRPHLVGAVPDFDALRLAFMFRDEQSFDSQGGLNLTPWHYHLIDVENLAVGYLMGLAKMGAPEGEFTDFARPPWESEGLSRAVGIDPDQFERHTAMGDVLWARAIYDKVMG